jgi:hypothetical protein
MRLQRSRILVTSEGTLGSATPGAKGEYKEIGIFTVCTF